MGGKGLEARVWTHGQEGSSVMVGAGVGVGTGSRQMSRERTKDKSLGRGQVLVDDGFCIAVVCFSDGLAAQRDFPSSCCRTEMLVLLYGCAVVQLAAGHHT
mmetsp:Transcript_60054/g.107146  ORF Transcript_60054/g.107146 Transcript_60054/m.107146 type:complete len:101 (-) Transcript_60054:139-441(-)